MNNQPPPSHLHPSGGGDSPVRRTRSTLPPININTYPAEPPSSSTNPTLPAQPPASTAHLARNTAALYYLPSRRPPETPNHNYDLRQNRRRVAEARAREYAARQEHEARIARIAYLRQRALELDHLRRQRSQQILIQQQQGAIEQLEQAREFELDLMSRQQVQQMAQQQREQRTVNRLQGVTRSGSAAAAARAEAQAAGRGGGGSGGGGLYMGMVNPAGNPGGVGTGGYLTPHQQANNNAPMGFFSRGSTGGRAMVGGASGMVGLGIAAVGAGTATIASGRGILAGPGQYATTRGGLSTPPPPPPNGGDGPGYNTRSRSGLATLGRQTSPHPYPVSSLLTPTAANTPTSTPQPTAILSRNSTSATTEEVPTPKIFPLTLENVDSFNGGRVENNDEFGDTIRTTQPLSTAQRRREVENLKRWRLEVAKVYDQAVEEAGPGWASPEDLEDYGKKEAFKTDKE